MKVINEPGKGSRIIQMIAPENQGCLTSGCTQTHTQHLRKYPKLSSDLHMTTHAQTHVYMYEQKSKQWMIRTVIGDAFKGLELCVSVGLGSSS